MNYRHAYHAGNFADVFKHIIWTRIVAYLQHKQKAIRLYDTHAGIGLYDLQSDEAAKTKEWHNGISRLLEAEIPDNIIPLVRDYLACIRHYADNEATKIKFYPGSPLITRHMMRVQDRLAAYELHSEDFDLLKQNFERDYQARITKLDGWLALTAHVPPKEKRGAVLIDPPFEAANEFDTIAGKVLQAFKKWPGGTYALWYPPKNPNAVGNFIKKIQLAAIPDVLRMEIAIDEQKPDGPMRANGMLVINPPYTLKSEAQILLPWLEKIMAVNKSRHLIESVSQG